MNSKNKTEMKTQKTKINNIDFEVDFKRVENTKNPKDYLNYQLVTMNQLICFTLQFIACSAVLYLIFRIILD